ncbi:flagellar hook-basal body protein [Rubeoparvulum massiliense]|uniref:flagellar hook-basal body protein n=1 Tax=Rubeoparvulum massiliense TaxID=1631346 RepID=UPI00065DE61F|nr:flagellar hook-basal body protein [Rubeoparvulum massiliense]
MIRGLYTAAAGMIAQERIHDALTNNIANVQTAGYKQDQVVERSFPELLIQRIRDGQPQLVGPLNTGVYAQELIPTFTPAPIVETNQPLELAIDDSRMPALPIGENETVAPRLFFKVLDQNGEISYTRQGRFFLDGSGYLVTPEGYQVLDGENEPIQLLNEYDQPFDPTMSNLFIDGQGNVVYRNPDYPLQTTEELGKIDLVLITNPNELVKAGTGYYRYQNGNAAPAPTEDATAAYLATQSGVKQGFIEKSNVDPATTVSDMMQALRVYEANQKVLQSYDQLLGRAVNDLAKI